LCRAPLPDYHISHLSSLISASCDHRITGGPVTPTVSAATHTPPLRLPHCGLSLSLCVCVCVCVFVCVCVCSSLNAAFPLCCSCLCVFSCLCVCVCGCGCGCGCV